MKHFMKQFTVGAILGLAMIVSGVGQANATMIVAPNSLAGTEGNFNNGFPFNISDPTIDPFTVSSQRVQQVYDASEFSSLSTPALITHITFRPDGTFGNSFASVLANIQINLSTTTMAPDALSLIFANNVGADDTVVHSGVLALSSADTGVGPRDFDIVIALTTLFLYDPTAGNLLLDVRNFDGGMTTFFDAHTDNNDGISRVGTLSPGTVNSLVADIADSTGLVTKFTVFPVPELSPVQPVPEPGTLLLLGTGLAGIVAWRSRKHRA